jgi:hypothetical protein
VYVGVHVHRANVDLELKTSQLFRFEPRVHDYKPKAESGDRSRIKYYVCELQGHPRGCQDLRMPESYSKCAQVRKGKYLGATTAPGTVPTRDGGLQTSHERSE